MSRIARTLASAASTTPRKAAKPWISRGQARHSRARARPASRAAVSASACTPEHPALAPEGRRRCLPGLEPGHTDPAGTGNPAQIRRTDLSQRHRDQPGNGTMNPATTLRKLGKLEYTAARLPLSLLDAWVARHWHEDTAARVGFDRYLGTLDLLA